MNCPRYDENDTAINFSTAFVVLQVEQISPIGIFKQFYTFYSKLIDDYLSQYLTFHLCLVYYIIPCCVGTRQQYFLFWKVLSEANQIFHEFVLSQIEVGKIAELIRAD